MILRFLAKRLALNVAMLGALSVLVFAAIEVLPGDSAVYALAGENPTPELLAQTRHRLGLDRPAVGRYTDWIQGLLHGNFGMSTYTNQSVWSVIHERIGNTVILGGLTMLVVIPLALAVGVYGGTREGRAGDRITRTLTIGFVAIPEFVLGAVLIVVFAFGLHWFPATSLFPTGDSPLAHPQILVLPAMTLIVAAASGASRQVRVGLVDVMHTRYVELARLKGLPERRVLTRHAIPNAIAPSLQVLASSLGVVIGGSVIVETVFTYPGLGSALATAVVTRDFPLIDGIVMLLAIVLLLAYTAADLAALLLSPTYRTES